MLAPLNESVLPHGIRSRLVAGINGLTVHVLEAGFETPHRPLVLLRGSALGTDLASLGRPTSCMRLAASCTRSATNTRCQARR